MSWGKLTGKFMPRLYSPSVQVFFDRLWRAEGSRYLRELIANGAYGVLPPGDSYSPELPIKFVRSAEMKPSLDIDLESCPQVAQEYFISKARARKDDILLAVKGATIASRKSVAHVKEDIGDAVVNGSIFRMQAKAGVNARFLAIALSTEFAKRQMKLALVANNGVDYLDKTLIHKLVIPTPKLANQNQLVARYDFAVAKSQEFGQKADALLASIDDYLFSQLGIVLPPSPAGTIINRSFRVSMNEIRERHDPNFFARKYVNLTNAITAHPYKLLRDICRFSSETWDQKSGYESTFPYLEISGIDLKTGDVTEISDTPLLEAPSRARMIARQNDILVSTTRPSRGAITLLDKGHSPSIASTGFSIIRNIDAGLINREYLYFVLRSKIGLTQMEQRSSGGNYPAITPSELKRIEIPLPDLSVQKQIVVEIQKRKSAALSMRQEANVELEKTKSKIEAILLGDAA